MNAYAGGMQRIYELDLTPEEHEEQDIYLKVEPEAQCPSCFKASNKGLKNAANILLSADSALSMKIF